MTAAEWNLTPVASAVRFSTDQVKNLHSSTLQPFRKAVAKGLKRTKEKMKTQFIMERKLSFHLAEYTRTSVRAGEQKL
ncbi:hypothetical protein Y1Q_0000056 [Alligator mississippiensis]|uniref:Uncharacterized protein n=1 Tax=Alligator mississippiensis TaxID=8496 RepID=A0A151NUX3_ALLMI|nr:hypothetical protein Y1Q_0000056 [Alligator mississippiensis]